MLVMQSPGFMSEMEANTETTEQSDRRTAVYNNVSSV